MKEDILEQLVEDWLQADGYFTRANLKFKPSREHPDWVRNADSVASDIDVLGFHPRKTGSDKVVVVGCKSWQEGFPIAYMLDALENDKNRNMGGREAWKHFRELVVPKWTDAFISKIEEYTGQRHFTYITAITRAADPKSIPRWEGSLVFKKNLEGNPLSIITLEKMLGQVFDRLGTAVESSQFSRTLQLIKAAGISMNLKLDK